MNERIRELAEQARKALAVDVMGGGEFNMKAYEEKFAELIVRECIKINIVETTASNLPEYNLGMLEGYRRARENISIHFGVE